MLTDEQIKRMADFHLEAMLSEDDNARLDEERKDEAKIGNELNLTSKLLAASKHELASNNLSSVSEDADLLIKFFKIDPETASPSLKKLCLELLRRNVQRFEIEMKRVAGEHVEHPTFSHKSQVQTGTAPGSLDIKAPKSLKERIERYIAEKRTSKAWKDKSERSFTAALAIMLSYFGDCPIQSITHEKMFDFRDNVLVKLPSNQAKLKELKGKSLSEIAEADGFDRMSIRTVNEKLSTMASFLSWCQKHGDLASNPGAGLQLKDNRRASEERSTYSKEDLEKALKAITPLRGGKHPERYWIPIIALYSGMRQSEIAQLYVDDVKQADGIWCFDINESSEDKSVKSKAGIRQVPVHPELIAIGLLDYRESLIKRNAKRMWPELECKRDGYGQTFQRWYGRFNRENITDDTRKCFHSFRHNFMDAFKQELANDAVIKALVGHENEALHIKRYGKQFKTQVLFDAIKTLDYGLDLPSLLSLRTTTEEAPSKGGCPTAPAKT